eukprot:27897_1
MAQQENIRDLSGYSRTMFDRFINIISCHRTYPSYETKWSKPIPETLFDCTMNNKRGENCTETPGKQHKSCRYIVVIVVSSLRLIIINLMTLHIKHTMLYVSYLLLVFYLFEMAAKYYDGYPLLCFRFT